MRVREVEGSGESWKWRALGKVGSGGSWQRWDSWGKENGRRYSIDRNGGSIVNRQILRPIRDDDVM